MTRLLHVRVRDEVFVDSLLDDDVYELVSGHAWRLFGAGYVGRKVYSHSVNGKSFYKMVYLHRLVTSAPDGQVVDHINRNKLDNRRANLRVCSASQNLWNRGSQATKHKRPATSRFKGVSRVHPSAGMKTKQWVAQIRADGKAKHLGYFATEDEAAAAYDAAATDFHGEFAGLNGLSQ